MNNIPVDQTDMVLTHIQTVAKMKQDDRGRQVQAANRDGIPQWSVRCLVTTEEGKPELLEVTMAFDNAPILPQMGYVAFDSLVARQWNMEGRSGMSFSATGVKVIATPPGAPAATNGQAPKPKPEPANA